MAGAVWAGLRTDQYQLYSRCVSVQAVLSWLVQCGLDLGLTNINGLQPLHAAVKQRLPEATSALCRLGVDSETPMGSDGALSPLQVRH